MEITENTKDLITNCMIQRLSTKEALDYLKENKIDISDFNSKVWNEKKEKGLSLKDSIKIEIPKELEIFKKDLVAMHHLE